MSAPQFLPTRGATGCPCPSWCSKGDSFHRAHGTDHQRPIGQLPATATEPREIAEGYMLPRVSVEVYLEDQEHPQHVNLTISADLENTASGDLYPHEARRLAALLLEAADVLEGHSR